MRQSISQILCGLLLAGVASAQDRVPDDLESVLFSGSEVTPSPASMCVAPTGEVFVGVDMNGSLGKGAGKGTIVRLIDSDNDGVADSHTVFAEADSVRGLISLGTKVWALHTTYDAATNKASGMDLVLFEDQDWDGVADGPSKVLIKGICSVEALASRGTDHSTNGIRMGIDGWIYIAVGDFGFHNARGADGREMTLLGGGIVRVRPDGTEMELYTKGLRNIYDVAIDPFMNIYTRGNTNDGGGWNVRFIHQIQSANYGYPSHFINFPAEMLPALEDVGGGSGVGALFLNEPNWPEAYNNQPLMADWGRNAVYLHRLEKDGASFTQTVENFVTVSQVTDLDVDASGRMYVSAWDGATFRGSSEKGYVLRVVPKDWKYEPFQSLSGASSKDLLNALASPSSTIRLAAQYEILNSGDAESYIKDLRKNIGKKSLSKEARVAALFTYAQLAGAKGIPSLLNIASKSDLSEWAVRAATDRAAWTKSADIDLAPVVAIYQKGSIREKAAAAVALGRIGKKEATAALLDIPYAFPEEKLQTLPQTPSVLARAKRTQKLEADITGYSELHLNSLEYESSAPSDRMHWMDPKIHLSNGETIDLTELDWKSAKTEHGPVEKIYDLTDLKKQLDKKKADQKASRSIGAPLDSSITYDLPEDAVKFTAVIAMEENGNELVPRGEFLVTPWPYTGEVTRSMHSDPDADRILPHLAFQALVNIDDVDTLLSALGTKSSDLAHWALRYLHSESVAEGVIKHLRSVENPAERRKTLTTLSRLYQREAPYDGSWWWTTRPDTRGPFYKPEVWSASKDIEAALTKSWDKSSQKDRDYITRLNDSHRMGIEKFGTFIVKGEEEEVELDLNKILSKKGAIATMALEDVLVALDNVKGKASEGRKLFTQQGCIACHTIDGSKEAIGPYMGQIGSIMKPDQIAEAILRPNATISQGFQTSVVTTTDGKTIVGFVTGRNSDEITLRDMTGKATRVAVKKVKSEDHLPSSMMPPGLANSLSVQEFASLVAFLADQK